MRRDQLEHAIRTACQIIGHPDVIVVGSQAILGSIVEGELPAAATMSMEVDILPIAADNDETARLADLIEGVAGEFSPFEDLHGFSIDGVDLQTSVLPPGWRDRLVPVTNANTAAPGGDPQFTGWCLDKEDLCVAKLAPCARKTATSLPLLSVPTSSTPVSSWAGSPPSTRTTQKPRRQLTAGLPPSRVVSERPRGQQFQPPHTPRWKLRRRVNSPRSAHYGLPEFGDLDRLPMSGRSGTCSLRT